MEVAALMGMYGFIAVTDRSEQHPDREFFLFMSEFWPSYIPLQIELMGFNGYAFVDNTPTLTARVGERVRWHVAALGLLPHVFHIHGHRWSDGKRYVDAQSVEASETLVLDWVEDDPGSWLYHCHYPEHFVMGMAGRYVVTP
jgi:FtsP/CotA-like multicopper oxidase with cupredoxin domain